MNPTVGECPQCSAALPSPRPSLCPRCHYPLLLAEEDESHEAVAADLRRPTVPMDDDRTVVVPAGERAASGRQVPESDGPVGPPGLRPQPLPPARSGPAGPRCSACGWQNAPGRQRCERCAARLGELSPAAPLSVEPPPPAPRRQGWMVVLAVLAVLAVGAGVAVFFLRPGRDVVADPPGRTPGVVATTPSASAPATALVQVANNRVKATASSVLPPAPPYRYDPDLLLDGNPATAWNSDGDAGGQPIEITFTFDGPVSLGRIEVANGYQSNKDAYARNRRVKRVLVVTDAQQIPLDLADSEGFQRFDRDFGRTTKAVLRIESDYPGNRYDDIAISEVRFFATG